MNLTRDSHYVPQSTLRRWSEDGVRVWAYRLLVSHGSVPVWSLQSIRGLVRHADLYTSFADGRDDDEFEKFITREFEEPGQEAVEKLLSESQMSPGDWRNIAKFVAAQQLRTPLFLVEYIRRAKGQIQESLEAIVRDFESSPEKLKREITDTPHSFLKNSLKVRIEPSSEGFASVSADVRSVRSLWLDVQRHHLTTNVERICAHRWRAAEPADGSEWPLTDHPVLTLNYYGPTAYDFRAGWGRPGSEFFMPVSPRLAVYTQVGSRSTGRFAFDADQTATVVKLSLERAFRWVIARSPSEAISQLRQREINAERFEEEREAWRAWHTMQRKAEQEF